MLIAGWLLGGTVGVGTVVYALAIGTLWQFFHPRVQAPLGPRSRPLQDSHPG